MIGYEFEFLVREGDIPLTRSTFLKFHEELKKRGWKNKFDPDTKGLLGSHKDGIAVVTDDGINNMEIEMPPTETIAESHARLEKLLEELQSIYKSLGASIVGIGVFPGPIDLKLIDYKSWIITSRICQKSFIHNVVPKRWREHYWTQLFSGIHVWLDLPKNEIIRHLSIFNRLHPFFVALFANGPVFDQKELGVLEGRNALWIRELKTSTIPYDFNIYGMYTAEYKTIFDYFDFLLDDPLYFSTRGDVAFSLKDKKKTNREHLFSKESTALWGHGGEFSAKPELIDFFWLQNATFPHTRLKFFFRDGVMLEEILTAIKNKDEPAFLKCFKKFCFEIRTASAQKKEELSTAPALYLGLQSNLEKAEKFANKFSYDELLSLYEKAEKKGLQDDPKILEGAKELLSIAREGLEKRGEGEEKYLAPLLERIKTGKNPADELLEIWRKDGLAGIWEARDF